jgi:hypothetical protein
MGSVGVAASFRARYPRNNESCRVNSELVFEFEVTDTDGQREVRLSSSRRELYPAEAWAREHAALGLQVRRRRRIIVLEPWTDLPGS